MWLNQNVLNDEKEMLVLKLFWIVKLKIKFLKKPQNI